MRRPIYTQEEQRQLDIRDALEDARDELRAEVREEVKTEVREEVCEDERVKNNLGWINKGKISVEEAAEEMNISRDEFIAKAKKLGFELK